MSISTLTPLSVVPRMHEGSSLRSPREQDGMNKAWKYITDNSKRNNVLSQLVNQLSREFQTISERKKLTLDLYPFKIYTLADNFRPTSSTGSFNPANNWRTVRVRGGLVLNNTVTTGSIVTGTDLMQNYSYTNQYPSASVGPYDITVPLSSSQYWFWIYLPTGATSGQLAYGSNPALASDSGVGQWTSFPSASSNYIPIGYVDTNTSGSSNVAYVRQILTSDIIQTSAAPQTTGYYVYNTGSYYNAGDTVRVNSQINVGTYVITPGTYGCMSSITSPMSPLQFPQYPEPSGSYWMLVAFPPTPVFVAYDTQVYINASTPF